MSLNICPECGRKDDMNWGYEDDDVTEIECDDCYDKGLLGGNDSE